MSKIVLTLERMGEQMTYTFNTDIKSLISASKKLQQFVKQDWRLTDCTGEDERIVGYVQHQIEAFKQNPKGYSVPVKETLAVAKDVTGASTKQILSAGKKAVKQKLLHPFKKEKQDDRTTK